MFINHNMLRISIDLEEWYHDMPISDWDHLPSNLSRNTMKLLNLFDSFNIKAKFYCVGYVAKRYPELILEIYRRGHIIGCHSYYHKPLYYHNQFSFEEDLSKSTNIISEIIEDKLIYYRLPMFSYNHEPFFYPLLKKYRIFPSSCSVSDNFSNLKAAPPGFYYGRYSQGPCEYTLLRPPP